MRGPGRSLEIPHDWARCSPAKSLSLALVAGEARLIVPLRVQGRVHGALVMTAAPPAVLNPAHIGPAQRLADVLAPHLELLRRAAMLPQPFRPGWKREHRP